MVLGNPSERAVFPHRGHNHRLRTIVLDPFSLVWVHSAGRTVCRLLGGMASVLLWTMKSVSSAPCGLDVNCPHSLMSCLLAPAAGDAILADAQNLRRILKETLSWAPFGTGMGSWQTTHVLLAPSRSGGCSLTARNSQAREFLPAMFCFSIPLP